MEYKDLDVDDFASYIKGDGVQLLDVRTPEEYNEGHLSGAVNVDWLGKDFMPIVEQTFDKERPIALYCRSGRRSAEAARALASRGFDTSNLEGGILVWIDAGEPVV